MYRPIWFPPSPARGCKSAVPLFSSSGVPHRHLSSQNADGRDLFTEHWLAPGARPCRARAHSLHQGEEEPLTSSQERRPLLDWFRQSHAHSPVVDFVQWPAPASFTSGPARPSSPPPALVVVLLALSALSPLHRYMACLSRPYCPSSLSRSSLTPAVAAALAWFVPRQNVHK